MLSWMFQHDYLDTCCFECACVLYFCIICTCLAQLSMFHIERHSRNTLIIIIIIIVVDSAGNANKAPTAASTTTYMQGGPSFAKLPIMWLWKGWPPLHMQGGACSGWGLFVYWLLNVPVSQGWICSDNCTCCHTEIEVADPTFYLTQSQYTDTGLTSPSTGPITQGI